MAVIETRKASFTLGFLKSALRIGNRGCFANNQLGRDGQFRRILAKSLEPLQQNSRRGFSHIAQRLPNGCESGGVVGRELDIVEADHGNVIGHRQIGVLKSANRANGGHIVESYNCRESLATLQERLNHRITQLG